MHITTQVAQSSFSFGPVSVSPGGNAINVARQLNHLGEQVELYGIVGDDPEGMLLCAALINEGIETAQMLVLPNQSTSRASILLETNNPPRVIVQTNQSSCQIEYAELNSWVNNIAHGDVVFFPAFPNYTNLLSSSEMRIAEVFVDYGYAPYADHWEEYRSGFLELIPHVDFIITCAFDYQPYQFEFLSEALVHARCRAVIVTFAGNGILLLTSEIIRLMETDKVESINPIGAGDSFIGAFIFFYKQGLPIEDCLYNAHQVAKWKVSQFDSLLNLEQFKQEVNQ
ncbi:fructoselysine 6-kinase [compost metagenome]